MFSERLGLAYANILILRTLAAPDAPAQAFPPTAWDRDIDVDANGNVMLVVADIPADGAPVPPAIAGRVRVEDRADGVIIHNGGLAVRLPAAGAWTPPLPSPFAGWSRDGGVTWLGGGSLRLPYRGTVFTAIESVGPAGAQWRGGYRWGSANEWTLTARWAAGSDTILVAEAGAGGPGAYWELIPFNPDAPATAWHRGGGENPAAMTRMALSDAPDSRRGVGERCLGRLSHIAYYNQWCTAWAGFAGDGVDHFLGVFSARGGLWRLRGSARPEIIEDDARGAFLRFPLVGGQRLWGLTLADRAASRMDDPAQRNLLNERKIQHSDLAPAKVSGWRLDAGGATAATLFTDQQRDRLRRVRDHERLAPLARTYLETCDGRPEIAWAGLAAAIAVHDEARLRYYMDRLDAWAEKTRETLVRGGYEGVVIFEGRAYKRHAHEIDWLRGEGLLPNDLRDRLERVLTVLPYLYADPDYCRYEDFSPVQPLDAEDADHFRAMGNEMGDSPVPPNFASEFFSTVGMAAELFPHHPEAPAWRAFAVRCAELFLDRWFFPDGGYRESINYHTHAVAEMFTWLLALRQRGGPDLTGHPRVRGSYNLFCRLLTPPLAPAVGDDPVFAEGRRFAAGDRAFLPANGNSGNEGRQQEVREDLLIAADAYAASDPELSGRLRRAWRRAGGPILGSEAPLLALAAFDGDAPEAAEPSGSFSSGGMGIVSKALAADGSERYALFRAGEATHHMCFDQGALFLVAGRRVLLGDHGYHTHDTDGSGLPAAATWLHSTVTYADTPALSSGYTGMESAPNPALTLLGDDYDYAALEIRNTDFRHLGRLGYNQMLPCRPIRHIRRYLYWKPDLWLLLDEFPDAPDGLRPTCWLWPTDAPVRQPDDSFRCGVPDDTGPALWVRWMAPTELEDVHHRQTGPLFGWGRRGAGAEGFGLALAALGEAGAPIVKWDWENRRTEVVGPDARRRLTVQWPAFGDANSRPIVTTTTC